MHTLNLLKKPGVYVLIFQIAKPFNVNVGGLGKVDFKPGTYLYVGSARGKGGIKARVMRHLSKEKKLKWHIDYLTSSNNVNILCVIYSYTKNPLEPALVRKLEVCLERVVKGFGSTDTRLYTHLFRTEMDLQSVIELVVNVMKELKCKPIVTLIT